MTLRRRVAPRVLRVVHGHRLLVSLTASTALLASLLVAAATSDDDVGDEVAPDQRLQHDFTAAADEYHVPRSVLLAVSYEQSRWDSHPGVPSVTGGYGPMHLTDADLARARAEQQAQSRAENGSGQAGSESAADLPELPSDLHRAARLIGTPARLLRNDAAANVRGGAALLAAGQRRLGKPLSADPADWWGAVAQFAGTDDTTAEATYADDVYAVMRKGARRTTDTRQHVTLAAQPRLRPRTVPLPGTPRAKEVECPPELSCSWLSAPHVRTGASYGNHDLADRPRDQKIDYIVIHDTEAPLKSMLSTVQDPTGVSWHYSVSASDGHITQHVRTRDEAWHSGNQFINDHSIGVEHEGFLKQPDAWYTEQTYQSSARLVRYLAKKYGIPLDRQHIIGHDNVPGPTAGAIPTMHEDPGPYWDWRHYFDLLGAPLRATAGPDSDMVTVLPDYATNKPRYTGCGGSDEECAAHGSSAVRLHTEPSDTAELVQDPGRHPDGADSTERVGDVGSRISTGQQYAVADRQGDWTAIWFLGEKAWFKNPRKHPVAVGASGWMVTPKDGLDEVPVYGRALPEDEAYPYWMPRAIQAPLPYGILAGQRYVTSGRVGSSFTDRSAFSESPSPVVKGEVEYYEVQFGHRVAFVRAADVDVVKAHPGPTS